MILDEEKIKNLEAYAENKSVEAASILRATAPDYCVERSDGNIRINAPFMTKMDESPLEYRQHELWDNLLDHRYWRAFPHINSLFEEENNPLTKGDIEVMTPLILDQICKGENIAANTPLFHDLFELVDKSSLKDYVTDEQRRWMINHAFWDTLGRMTNRTPHLSYVCKELEEMLYIESFFEHFDFKAGVEKSKALPELDFAKQEFHGWDHYMRWFLIQETLLIYNDEDHYETRGKLMAPMIEHLLSGWVDYEESEQLRKLASYFLSPKLTATKYVQNALIRTLEMQLSFAFDSSFSEDADYRTIDLCINSLADPDPIVEQSWKKHGSADNIPRLYRANDLIPASAFEDYVYGLKKELKAMKKFDPELYTKWQDLRIDKDVKKAQHTRMLNQALEVYVKQKPRPAGDISLQLLSARNLGSKEQRIKGVLLADLMRRKKWSYANDLLESYSKFGDDRAKQRFSAGLRETVEMHGLVKIDPEVMAENYFKPKFNFIADRAKNKRDFFLIQNEQMEME